MRNSVETYLNVFAIDQARPLECASLAGIDQVIVIPALAERDYLFHTLASLSGNPQEDINRSLVICVVNNRRNPLTDAISIEDNQETLHLLRMLIKGSLPDARFMGGINGKDLRIALDSGLRIACIDASSRGCELPDRAGGVGMARKIGMDAAVRLLSRETVGLKLILCLDADTEVDPNYLPAVRAFFEDQRAKAAVVLFTHRMPSDPNDCAAICCYEIFLRYYVLGLHYARSPYAFHAVGSTIVCTIDGYVSVRGMTIRDAAEDFYFLNKLAKIDAIRDIITTRVYPSARLSSRVPFGTGRRIIRYLGGQRDEYLLYAPEIFHLLFLWLNDVNENSDCDGYEIESRARDIHPLITSFLRRVHFAETWQRVRKNCRSSDQLKRQFMTWFDAFKTLKFINHLTKEGITPVDMFAASKRLLFMMGRECPLEIKSGIVPPIADQRFLIDLLNP